MKFPKLKSSIMTEINGVYLVILDYLIFVFMCVVSFFPESFFLSWILIEILFHHTHYAA